RRGCWVPEKLKSQLIAAHETGAAVIACDFESFDEKGSIESDGLPPRPRGFSVAAALLLGNHCSGGSAALVKKSVLRQLGGFDESLPAAEVVDMWRRIAWDHPIFIMKDRLLR